MSETARTAVFPLNTVLYPGGPLPLRIFEPRYVDMIGRCMRTRSPFVVSAIAEGNETGTASFHSVGTLATIVDFQQLPDGLLGVLAKGEQRATIRETQIESEGLNTCSIELVERESELPVPTACAELVVLLRQLLEQIPVEFYPESEHRFEDASWVGYRLAELLPLSLSQKQYFLEMNDPLRRLEVMQPLLESMQTDHQS